MTPGGFRPPAPVPGLVADAVGIPTRVGHVKTKRAGAAAEPAERRRASERFFDAHVFRGANIDCASGMVFTEARRCDVAENVVERATGGKFTADEQRLATHAAEAREREEGDAVSRGGGPHPAPSGGGTGCETHGLSFGRIVADQNQTVGIGFAEGAQVARGTVVGGDAERAVEGGETRSGHGRGVRVVAAGGGETAAPFGLRRGVRRASARPQWRRRNPCPQR